MPFEIAVGCNLRKSPYYDATVADGVACFSVYNHMLAPSHFGDPLGEYQALLDGVVFWDVACERQVQLQGPDAETLLRYLTPRQLPEVVVGQGKYIPMCDYDGMLINDPVLLPIAADCFWLSIADSDILLWAKGIAAERGLDVTVSEPDVSPLAVQGPLADEVVASLFGDWVRELKYFWFQATELDGIPLVLARSGWSKQGGFELYLQDGNRGSELYGKVKAAGQPYGIRAGAPSDIERVESGLVSYGSDARYGVNPFEIGLDAMVQLDRDDDFIGKQALRAIKASGIKRRRHTFEIDGDRISGIEHHQAIYAGEQVVGTLTEAVYSPRFAANIAVGMLASNIDAATTALSADLGDGRRAVKIRGDSQ